MATESESKVKGFKRINFFKGFLTTEHDWNDAERYHIEKRRLHNKMMHAPGVVFGFSGDLKVTARPRGDLSVEIQPGYAVDGQGRDLMLWDAEIKTLVLEEYKLPQTIYIVLRYYEQETDFIAYKRPTRRQARRQLPLCRLKSQGKPPKGSGAVYGQTESILKPAVGITSLGATGELFFGPPAERKKVSQGSGAPGETGEGAEIRAWLYT
jgi:hypothetical protein